MIASCAQRAAPLKPSDLSRRHVLNRLRRRSIRLPNRRTESSFFLCFVECTNHTRSNLPFDTDFEETANIYGLRPKGSALAYAVGMRILRRPALATSWTSPSHQQRLHIVLIPSRGSPSSRAYSTLADEPDDDTRSAQNEQKRHPDLPRLPFRFETGVGLFAKRPPRPFPPPFLSPPSVSFSDPLSTHDRARAVVNGERIRGHTNGDDAIYASDFFICANDGVGAWATRPRGHAGYVWMSKPRTGIRNL